MTVSIPCRCGRQLPVSREPAGRRLKCPGCGAEVAVPAGGRPAAREPAPAARRRRALWAWLVAACVAGALLAGGLWWWQRDDADGGEDLPDLALVPPDVRGFVAVRAADIWKVEAARRAFEQARKRLSSNDDAVGRLERDAGLTPADLERVTAVFADASGETMWFSVRTTHPYDRRGLLNRLAGRQRLRHAGRRYHVGTTADGKRVAVFFAGPRVLLAGPEAGVRECLEFLAEPRETGPLQEPLKLAEGPDQVVGAFHPVQEQREHMARGLLQALKPLAQIRFATLRANLGETSRAEATLTFGDAARAAEGKKAIADGVKLANFMLQLARLHPPEGLGGDGLDRIAAALKAVKARQNGQKLSVEIKAEGADLLVAAAALWASSR